MNITRPYATYISDTAAGFIINFSILGTIGNILTIIAFGTISDLILSAISLPILSGQLLFDNWLFDKTLCRVSTVILYGNLNVTLLSMTAIAITRYFMVLKPTVYPRYFTDKNVSTTMILIWIFSYLERVPPTFDLWGTIDVDPKTFFCGSFPNEGQSIDPNLVLGLIAFFTPCLVMSYSYVSIYLKIKKTRENVKTHDRVLIDSIDDEKYYPELHVFHTVLSCAIVFINPIIYACSNKRYRNAYKAIFKSGGNDSSHQPDISCQTPRCLPTK
ncbi:protein trapped in endoderm-1-like [Aphidius gifuensis]|uniref:protein trapped in endoderm-1-like n=1 Tax=Aphidius gifuensis TaxID=684658 RepID=UPI001CDCCFFF|nr:protein trapped in endoderm-1-like [Aphidius gifuensis]